MKSFPLTLSALIAISLTSACTVCPDEGCEAGGSDEDDEDEDPTGPACTVFGKPHIGLGGEDLAATNNVRAYSERVRAKPYTALLTDYSRVLGTANRPASLDRSGTTFGEPAARWYVEPTANAMYVNAAYDVAFEGCLRLTGDLAGGTADPRFATAPTSATARAVCGEWMRKLWSREGTPTQIDECVASALESTTETYGGGPVAEVVRPATPKRQWAYACAGVLTSSGFVTF